MEIDISATLVELPKTDFQIKAIKEICKVIGARSFSFIKLNIATEEPTYLHSYSAPKNMKKYSLIDLLIWLK